MDYDESNVGLARIVTGLGSAAVRRINPSEGLALVVVPVVDVRIVRVRVNESEMFVRMAVR